MSWRKNTERIVDDVLRAAGLTAGVVRPDPYPAAGFVVFFGNGGNDDTRVTQVEHVELEGWGVGPFAARDILDAAVSAIHAAAGTRGIRHVSDAGAYRKLPTGEENWDRYTTSVAVTTRKLRTRPGGAR